MTTNPEDPEVVAEELEETKDLWEEHSDVEAVQEALDRLIAAVQKMPWDPDPIKRLSLMLQDTPGQMVQDVLDGKAELK